MKRYILFAGEWYHPSGGVYEIVGAYETEQQALEAHERVCRRSLAFPDLEVKWIAEWAHILDIEAFKVRVWSVSDERWSDWKEWYRLDTVNSDPRTEPPTQGGDDEKVRA